MHDELPEVRAQKSLPLLGMNWLLRYRTCPHGPYPLPRPTITKSLSPSNRNAATAVSLDANGNLVTMAAREGLTDKGCGRSCGTGPREDVGRSSALTVPLSNLSKGSVFCLDLENRI